MNIVNATVFCDDGVFRTLDVETRGDRILSLSQPGLCGRAPDTLDCEAQYLVPGFFDLHIHGAMGADFCDGGQAVEVISRFLARKGVTSFLGTSMALPRETLEAIYREAGKQVNRAVPGRSVLRGINMEGPFFSQARRGAQNEAHIVEASWEVFRQLNAASCGHIRTLAVAPEIAGASELIEKAAAVCSVSLAHSEAGYETASRAFALGANHVTHLFNGMEPFHHRDPGIVGAAADAGAYVEIICDGAHLHPAVVRAVFRLFGDDKVCLISDAMRACGMPDGQYELGGKAVTVRGGAATVEGGSLAGSTTSLYDCFRKAVAFGVPLESALRAASANPAKSVGLADEIGGIRCGKRADLLVLDRELGLKKVILGGELLPAGA